MGRRVRREAESGTSCGSGEEADVPGCRPMGGWLAMKVTVRRPCRGPISGAACGGSERRASFAVAGRRRRPPQQSPVFGTQQLISPPVTRGGSAELGIPPQRKPGGGELNQRQSPEKATDTYSKEASTCFGHIKLIKMGNGLSDQSSLLSSLPLFHSFHIVILGLDCAGKTTVLYRLQFNEFVNTVPTKGFNSEKIKVLLGNSKSVTFHFWDVGGQEKLRPLWKSYTRCTDGIVFVVDSVDIERMEEAKTELYKITKISENQGVPVLVVANKQDLRNCLSLSEMEKLLALHELSSSTPWHLQPTCAIIGEGLTEGLEKLHDMIIKRRKMLRQQKKKR